MALQQSDFVILDVETTGLFPTEGDRIVEIAVVKLKDGTICETFDSLINPQRKIPLGAQRVHQITDKMTASAPDAKEILPKVIEFIGGASIVGHNIKFDLDFFCYELAGLGRRLKRETPAIDTLKMSKRLLPHLKTHRLSGLAQSLGVKAEETHRALADATITANVFKDLVAIAKKQGIDGYRDLVKQFSVQKPNFKIQEVKQGLLF